MACNFHRFRGFILPRTRIGLPEVLFLVREKYFAHVNARQLKLHALPPPPVLSCALGGHLRSSMERWEAGKEDLERDCASVTD